MCFLHVLPLQSVDLESIPLSLQANLGSGVRTHRSGESCASEHRVNITIHSWMHWERTWGC